MIITTHSPEETRALGRRLSVELESDMICLFGEMGCGKTEFVKGFLEGLDYQGDVTSPTYALCHRYDARKTVFHYDLYRLSGYDDLYSIGFFDREPGSVSLVEWSENAIEYLPKNAIRIWFEYGQDADERKIRIGETNHDSLSL